MKGKYLRDLVDRIDVGRDEVYHEILETRPVAGSAEDADRDFGIARYLFLNGNYEGSISRFEAAVTIYRSIGDKVGECYSLVYNSMNYREMRNINETRRLIRAAHDLAVEISDNYAVLFTILNSLTLYSLENRDDEAELLRKRAGQMIDDVGHPKLAGDYHNNTGQSLIRMSRHEEALEHLNLAYACYLEHYQNPQAVNVIISRINRTYALSMTGRLQEALDEITEVHRMMENQQFDSYLAIEVHNSMVEIYEKMGDFKNAYLSSLESTKYTRRWMEESTKRPRTENVELKQQLEYSLESLTAKNKELNRNNEALEEIVRNNEFIKKIGSKLTSAYEYDEIFDIFSKDTAQVMEFNTIAVGMLEGNEVVITRGVFLNLPAVELPIHLPMDSDQYMFTYCVKNNVDVKIDCYDDFLKYLPNKMRLAADPRSHEDLTPNESAIYCRLLQDGKPFGVLTIQNVGPYVYSDLDFDYFKTIAAFVSVAIVNSVKKKQVQDKANQLEALVLLDPLTMLHNRRAFNREIEALEAERQSYALLFADMNHLKVINDSIGHEEGDKYLSAVAELLSAECGEHKVFRLSGDEFASLLVGTSREEAYDLVRRIKNACKEKTIGKYPVALAIGCSFSSRTKSADEMFSSAEARMYKDKHDYYMLYGDSLKRREPWMYKLSSNNG